GRATLYKYFPDAEAILREWHLSLIDRHLQELREAATHHTTPGRRLRAVLEQYAVMTHESRNQADAELAGLLHHDVRLASADRQLEELLRELLADAASAGQIRRDIGVDVLTAFCVHALQSAGQLKSKSAALKLVDLVLEGLGGQSLNP